MAQTVQDPIRERIEIVDQPEDISEQGSKRLWLIPIALVVIATLFFVVRRFTSQKEF